MIDQQLFPCIDYDLLENNEKFSFILSFCDFVWDWYALHKRDFVWRETRDPYHILLSELMLQQTQTERVVPKYNLFLEQWPTLYDLSQASLTDVLYAWKGLGYNRRAKALHTIGITSKQYNYSLPHDESLLRSFPMIGPSTAAAILSFAYGEKSVYLETNIRRVIIHHFFSGQESVHDRQIKEILQLLIANQENARDWYYALMDYGVFLKKSGINPNRRSLHYAKQSPFENSNRQIRSTLLFIITQEGQQKESTLLEKVPFEDDRILAALETLQKDGLLEAFVSETEPCYKIP